MEALQTEFVKMTKKLIEHQFYQAREMADQFFFWKSETQ
jgi:hypothetical protein